MLSNSQRISLFRSRLAVIAVAVVIALGNCWRAPAQVLYGSLVGNVTDVNGAVVPDAAATATNQETGIAKTTKTDASGTYQFLDLQPGTYSLKIAVSGFKTYERRDLPVSANNVTRNDVGVEIGSIEQSITVTGVAPALQTDRAEVRANISAAELENLPVTLGRNYQQVYRTLPGFSPPVNSHSIPTNPRGRWNSMSMGLATIRTIPALMA